MFGASFTEAEFRCVNLVCVGTTPTAAAVFTSLQRELNRVRPLYGLAPDVVVDGKLGVTTTAKLIKLAQKIAATVRSDQVHPALETYYIESVMVPGPDQVARDAVDLVSALRRNGMITAPPPSTSSPTTPQLPTAPTPSTSAAGKIGGVPKTVWVGLGLVAVLGITAVVLTRR